MKTTDKTDEWDFSGRGRPIVQTPEGFKLGERPPEDREALEKQVGGRHYKDLAIEPVEFSMVNQWDFCAASLLKYLTRYKGKGGLQDLEKAEHYVSLRKALHTNQRLAQQNLPMSEYVVSNELPPAQAAPLFALEAWVLGQTGDTSAMGYILSAIEGLKQEYKS